MSDDPDLDPTEPDEGDAHIRALLAELGSGPDGRAMPPEVAARLDATLARLVAERETDGPATEQTDAHGPGTVVPLRRRWLPRATAAAAAVIVVGAGGVAAANLGVFGNGAATSSDSGGAADAQAESAPEATSPSPGSKSLTRQDSGADASGGAPVVPQVSARSFASDVTSLLQRRSTAGRAEEAPTTGAEEGGDAAEKSTDLTTPEQARQSPGSAFMSASCPGPELTDGSVPNQIRYDEQLAVLVIHPEKAGRQLVEAWTCAGDRRLAETTITP